MEDFVKAVGVGFLLIAAVFVAVVLGTLFGALAGWIVGLFFDNTILGTLARFGVKTEGLAMWQLGATLGFIGGFFRATVQKSSD